MAIFQFNRNSHRRISIIFVLLFFIANNLFAQNFCQITGIVTSDEEPITGVDIIIRNTDQGTTSDMDGRFILSGIHPGQITLEFHMIGYEKHHEDLTLQPGDILTLSVKLQQTALLFSPILIYGKNHYENLKRTESSLRLITPEMIDQIPTVGDADIFRTLQTRPEVTTVSEFSNQLYVRGGTPDQNLILINGAPIYQPYHLFGIATAMNIDAIESVQFYTGGFSARYGDRLSSVLDITSAPGSDELLVKAKLNLINSKISIAGPLTEKVRWRLSMRRMYFDKIAKLMNYDFPYYFYDTQGKLSWVVSTHDLITFNFFTSYDLFQQEQKKDSYIPNWGEPPEIQYADSNYYYELTDYDIGWRNNLFSIQYLKNISSSHLFEASVYISTLRHDFFYNHQYYPGIEASLTTIEYVEEENEDFKSWGYAYSDARNLLYDLGANVYHRWTISPQIALNSGLNFSRKILDYNWNIYDFAEFSRYATFFMDFAPDSFNYGKNYDTYALFVEANGIISPSLNARVGLRLPYYSIYNKVYPQPNFTLNWMPVKKVRLKASWGRYFQSMGTSIEYGFYSIGEIYLLSETKPEKAEHFIFDMSYHINRNSRINLSTYVKRFTNLLYMQADSADIVTNGKAISKGIEFSIENLQWKGFEFSLFYGWSKTKKTIQEETFFPNYHQEHKVSFLAGKKISDNYTLDLMWSFSSGRYANLLKIPYYTDPTPTNDGAGVNLISYDLEFPKNLFKYPYFHRLDVKITREIKTKNSAWYVYFQILNVYNRQNVLYYSGVSRKYHEESKTNTYELKLTRGFPIFPTIGVEYEL